MHTQLVVHVAVMAIGNQVASILHLALSMLLRCRGIRDRETMAHAVINAEGV